MNKIKAEIGMKVTVPKYNYNDKQSGKMKGTIIKVNKGYALVALDIGYKENFYYNDLHYIKE